MVRDTFERLGGTQGTYRLQPRLSAVLAAQTARRDDLAQAVVTSSTVLRGLAVGGTAENPGTYKSPPLRNPLDELYDGLRNATARGRLLAQDPRAGIQLPVKLESVPVKAGIGPVELNRARTEKAADDASKPATAWDSLFTLAIVGGMVALAFYAMR